MNKKKISVYLVVSFFLSIFFLQLIFNIAQKSLTCDEIAHLSAGYSYLKTGDYRMNKEHPPLMKLLAGVPLLFLKTRIPLEHHSWREGQEWLFGREFFYQNTVDADKLLFYGRLPIILLSLLLAFFVFQWTKELYGMNAGVLALFLYIFCPNIIAHSQLVTTDLGASCFIFLSAYTFWRYLTKPMIGNLIFVGLSLGCALASKFTTVILFPIYLFLSLFFYRKNRGKTYFQFFLSFFWILLIAFFVLALTYHFTGINNYFIGLKRILLEAGKYGHTSFLLGKYSNTGWRYYYLVAFLLKTPIVLLILILLRIFWRKKLSDNKWEYFLIIPIILIFLSASFSRKQLGIRYVLPIYPFLFVWVSQIIQTLDERHQTLKVLTLRSIILGLLSCWYLFSSLKIYPRHLSYFNELAGGPDNGWKYLADSNIDWGQDLKGLKKYLEKEKINEVILSYFGTADPHYYSINYQDLGTSTLIPIQGRINPLSTKKEILAVSVNNLLCIYFYDRTLFDWLKKKCPLTKIGYSIFVYDITNDIQSHEYLAQIYYNSGWNEEARWESERLLILQSDNSSAYFVLACLSANENKMDEAVLYYKKFLQKNSTFLPKESNLMSYSSYVLRTSREVKPQSYEKPLFNIGLHYFTRGLHGDALSVFLKVVKFYPNSVEGYNNLGVVYENLKNNAQAINAYQEAIRLKPNFVNAYFNLALLYWRQKQWYKVVEQLEKVLKLEPTHTQAQRYLTLAREELSRKQKN